MALVRYLYWQWKNSPVSSDLKLKPPLASLNHLTQDVQRDARLRKIFGLTKVFR